MGDGATTERACIVDALEEKKTQAGAAFIELKLVGDDGGMFEATYWRDKRIQPEDPDPLWDGLKTLKGDIGGRVFTFYQPQDEQGYPKKNRDGSAKLYVNAVAGIEGSTGGQRQGGAGNGRGPVPGPGRAGGLTIDQQIRRSALELALMAKPMLPAVNTIGATATLFAEHIRNGTELPI